MSAIEESPYVSCRNETIYNVKYLDGRTETWGNGNGAIALSRKAVADPADNQDRFSFKRLSVGKHASHQR